MIYEICAVVGVLVFIVIAYYLVKTLIALQTSLKDIHELSKKLETKIDPVSTEASTLLYHSSQLTKSVADKLEAFDPLLKSISVMGSVAHQAAVSLQERVEPERTKKQSNLNDILDLATLGLMLWQQIKKGEKNG
jgi:uncharacterized protein YoxC